MMHSRIWVALLLATATSAHADLIVSNFASGRYDNVYRFDQQSGAFVETLISGDNSEGDGLVVPGGLTIGPDGGMYVSDIWLNAIWRFDLSTRVLTKFVGSGSGGMYKPNSIAFGPDGNLYVCSLSAGILRFNGSTGSFIDVFVANGTAGMIDPSLMVFNETGSFYVLSRDKGIRRFSTDAVELLYTFTQTPTGIAIGPDGFLYMSLSNGVLRMNPSIPAQRTHFASMDNPFGLAFGPDGDLYAGSSHDGILRFDGTTGAYQSIFVQKSQNLTLPSFMLFTDVPETGFSHLVPLAAIVFCSRRNRQTVQAWA